MLGIPDFGIIAAFLLCILSTVACVVYGIVNWNKGGEDEGAQVAEEAVWEEMQEKVDESL